MGLEQQTVIHCDHLPSCTASETVAPGQAPSFASVTAQYVMPSGDNGQTTRWFCPTHMQEKVSILVDNGFAPSDIAVTPVEPEPTPTPIVIAPSNP